MKQIPPLRFMIVGRRVDDRRKPVLLRDSLSPSGQVRCGCSGRRDARSVGLEKMWRERTTEDVATQERDVVTSGRSVLSVGAKVAVPLMRVLAPVVVALVRIPTARCHHRSLLVEMPGRIWVRGSCSNPCPVCWHHRHEPAGSHFSDEDTANLIR